MADTDSFVHLHVHSEYSMLDGASRVDDMVDHAVKLGMPGIGITDHGNMYGVLQLYKKAQQAGIRPIIGMEAYFENGSRFDRPKRSELETYHLTLIAENDKGYKNLIKFSSQAFLDGYYYKPRGDWDLLEDLNEGLIATSGCLGGLVAQNILQDNYEAAKKAAGKYQDLFGTDNFFIELQDHNLKEDAIVNPQLIQIAKEIGAPLVATNDSHYTHAHDATAHDALLCVQTGSQVNDEKRFKFETEEFYIKTAQEMRHLFKDYKESCDNTLLIAQRANYNIQFGNDALPRFECPDGFTEKDYLRHLVIEGAKTRYGIDFSTDHQVVERINYELEVIGNMGFEAYFLVVWDLVKHAHDNGWRVGPGRGSAAGSIVSYCLFIVDVDPIKYDLLFERFLNPGRKEMPDIDMDFDSRYRSEMIKYASRKYGWDKVAQIITFSTIKARAAVRDSARVLGYPYALGDKLAKLMPPIILGRDTPLWACFKETDKFKDGYAMAQDLRGVYENEADSKHVLDVALGIEGLRRQDGIHAAAVVISDKPLTEYLPIQRKPIQGADIEESPVVTQFEMKTVEELGLLKMDFLGLRNLDIIDLCIKQIKLDLDIDIDFADIPFDDAKTYDLLQKAQSIGVFQLEGAAMRTLMKSLAPTHFEDIAALVALYRPGPMASNMHNEYADRKNGRKPVEFYHDDLKDVLSSTYGLMIYQEQLMRVAQKLAGYSLQEADELRKATGKKDRELIATHREAFVNGSIKNGYDEKFSEDMFDVIEPFADYSFNKSHAVAYGFISYQTAYLKANFPHHYLASLMTSNKGDKDKTAVYLHECRQMNIEVYIPDVNSSRSDFAVVEQDGKQSISFGMSAVRNVGEVLVDQIVEEREANGPFSDFFDFFERVPLPVLNKRTIESLIKAGGFDSLWPARKGLLKTHEEIISMAISRRKEKDQGIISLFDAVDDTTSEDSLQLRQHFNLDDENYNKKEKLQAEQDMLGLYVSDHPLQGVDVSLRRKCDSSISEFMESEDGNVKSIGGVITSLNKRYTKKGDLMATFTLEDMVTGIEVMVFPATMRDVSHLLEDHNVIVLKGRLDKREDAPKVMALEVTMPELGENTEIPPVNLKINLGNFTPILRKDLIELLKQFPGESEVFLHIRNAGETNVIKLPADFSVSTDKGLFGELRVMLGPNCIA